MLKRIVTAFFYYALEMVTFLTLLIAFLLLGGDSPVENQFVISYSTWLLFLFITAMLPMIWLTKQSAKSWLIIHLILMVPCGLLIWQFSLGTLVILISIPFWRMITVFEAPMQQDLLVKRFIIFIGALITAFLFLKSMYVYQESEWIHLITISLVIQGALVGIGMLTFQYFTAREQSGVSVFQWIKSQGTFFVVLAGLAVAAGILAIAMPYIRQLFVNIFELTKDTITALYLALFGWWNPEQQKSITSSQGMEENNQLEESDVLDAVISAEQTISPLIGQVLAFILVGIVIGFIVYVLYRLISSLYLRPPGASEAKSSKFQIEAEKQSFKSLFQRRQSWGWQSNPLRKKYQELLHIAHSKGELVAAGSTAREWSKEALAIDAQNRELSQSIERLNALYEQIRYGRQDTLSPEEVKVYEAEAKQLKREIKRLMKEKKKQGKG